MKVPDSPGRPQGNDVNPDLCEQGVLAFEFLRLAAKYQAQVERYNFEVLNFVAQSALASGGTAAEAQAALDSWHRRLSLALHRALGDAVDVVIDETEQGDQS